MPKKKGGKGKKRAKNKNREEIQVKELVLKEADQRYAKVIKMLGNNRLHCECYEKTGTQ